MMSETGSATAVGSSFRLGVVSRVIILARGGGAEEGKWARRWWGATGRGREEMRWGLRKRERRSRVGVGSRI